MISIIIPNRDNAARLSECLRAVLRECAGREDVEVIVVDNGSRDGSVEVARGYGVRVLEDRRMASPFAPRNTGIKSSKGEVIILLDSNCIPQKRWLNSGLEILNKGYAVISAKLVFDPIANGDYIAKFDALYSIITPEVVPQLTALPTTNLFVNRKVFAEFGLFVAPLRGLGDIEWTRRVHLSGGSLGLAERALVRYPAKSGRAFAKKMSRLGRGHKEWAIYKRGTLISLPYFLHVLKQFLPPSPKFVNRMFRLGQTEGQPIPLLVVFGLCYLTKVLRGWGMLFGAVHPDLYQGTEPEIL